MCGILFLRSQMLSLGGAKVPPIELNRDHMNTDHLELYPYICVYTNLMEDNEELYDIAQHLSDNPNNNLIFDWKPWSFFGTYGSANADVASDSSISQIAQSSENTNYFKEIKIFKRIQEITKNALNNYVQKYNVELPQKNFISKAVNIAKYNVEVDIGEIHGQNGPNGQAMEYHTDYSPDQNRQDNFLITCNLYFNDDYKKGGVIFNIEGDAIRYKPNAGDVIVFPSGSPLFPGNKKYLHAVETAYEKNKFISRNYIMYEN